MSFLSKIFNFDSSHKKIKEAEKIVEKINSLEPEIEKLSDKELSLKTQEFKNKIADKRKKLKIENINYRELSKNRATEVQKKEQEILNELLPEAFAVVRETSKRIIGERHYDVQLVGGIILHWSNIAEMKTGEGKTLLATLPLYLNSLLGYGAHLITVNDFLAKSHTQWMGPIFDFLNVSVGCIQQNRESYLFERKSKEIIFGEEHNLKKCTRKQAYAADIIYGTNNEFGFDYLRDNMTVRPEDQAQRNLYYCIIDEIDSILIDEARTPLIISAPSDKPDEMYKQFARIAQDLEDKADYEVDEKENAVSLTDQGIKKVELKLGLQNLYEEGGVQTVHHLNQALKAKTLFKKDKDYVIREGEIMIVDQFTGRLMHGRRYSEGLHQAIEAKEGVEIKNESLTYATITFQNLFRLYQKLSGMTGTAKTEEEEFYKIYGLEVAVIPTHRPIIREDRGDQIYKTESEKFQAIVEEIKEKNQIGQPILLGTIAIEKSEILSDMLTRSGVKHEVLNAKQHEREAKIIANAGKLGAVTVATNMAGRGVDIVLGGAKPQKNDKKSVIKEWQKNHQKVLSLGGLYVIGSERHESRRIDNQLRGRAGRQGDPGVSQFYVSMEDDLMRIFGGERIKNIMNILKMPKGLPIENKMITGSIESAQKRVEGHNFDIRKQLVEYDDVMNKHRETIYLTRNKVLHSKNIQKIILENINKITQNIYLNNIDNKKEIIKALKMFFGKKYLPTDYNEKINQLYDSSLEKYLNESGEKAYLQKQTEIGKQPMKEIEKAVYLKTIDTLWVEHLTVMEQLRESVGLVGYGQRDPLSEYKQEAYKKYNELQNAISDIVVSMLFKIEIQPEIENKNMSKNLVYSNNNKNNSTKNFSDSNQSNNTNKPFAQKVGRNDPCPCGSGKKYKKCCGR